MRSVYGPVLSRRFGLSLGIDATMPPKKCSFDCIYCQLGPTRVPIEKPTFIEGMTTPEKLRKDLLEYIPGRHFNVVTFSGSGEPTANKRLPELIAVVREIVDKPVYMLTNASFLSLDEVIDAVSSLDHVSAKLDARDQESYMLLNKPFFPERFDVFLEGHRKLRKSISGVYSVQIMFTRLTDLQAVLSIASKLDPDKIYVTLPYRRFKLLMPSEEEIEKARDYCREHGCIFFRRRQKSKKYITEEDIQDLVSRRPMSIKDLANALGVDEEYVRKLVEEMRRFGKVELEGDIVKIAREEARRQSFS